MKIKNISKFVMLTSLLVMNTTVNSFYQCVPKKEWVKSIIKENEKWKFVTEIKKFLFFEDGKIVSSFFLGNGKYKFIPFCNGKQVKFTNEEQYIHYIQNKFFFDENLNRTVMDVRKVSIYTDIDRKDLIFTIIGDDCYIKIYKKIEI